MTVYPLAIHLGPLELTGFGLMMMAAFLMAGWAIQLDLRTRGLDEDYAADIVIAGVIGGLIGAKLWYVLLTRDLDTLFRRGGFVWYGGFLGATAGILLNGWRRRVPARFTAEICAAPLALGYALGRVGCFLVNDDYGIPTSLPWAMKFPKGLPPTAVAAPRPRSRDRLAVRVVSRACRSGAVSRRAGARERRPGVGSVYAGPGDERRPGPGGCDIAREVAGAGGAAAAARVTPTEGGRAPRQCLRLSAASPPPPPQWRARAAAPVR